MPLRQSILKFTSTLSEESLTALPPMPNNTPRLISMASEVDADTIVVDTSGGDSHLPTPPESGCDSSRMGSEDVHLKQLPKGRAKRVSRVSKPRNKDSSLSEEEEIQARKISGQTLVTSTSQCSLVKEGIDALNLHWNMSSVFDTGSKADPFKTQDLNTSQDSLATINATEEEGRAEKAAAKKAKMEENAKEREEKIKAADAKATRRSSRASILTKAGDIVSGLASSMLGKRLRGSDDPKSSSSRRRPSSMIEPSTQAESTSNKKRRLSDSGVPAPTVHKPSRGPRDKRWLTAGLYAGQSRAFNPALSESKNKRKSMSKPEHVERENTVMPLPMFAGERLLKQGRDFKLPFDVFSPLPPGQPKPDEWRKVNKNVFVGDAAQEWRTSKFSEHSTCMCKAETGCDRDCMNRYMYYECDERNCNLAPDQCRNRSFADLTKRVKKGGKYNVGVEVIKTVDRGYGVRSNRTFEPNQIIVEYTGEIITQEECEDRMHTMYKENECYYLMLFDQNMIIDATRGSIARFVNHSCEPNCRMEKWTVGGKPRMALFAGDREIMTGEELTYDYNFDPYSQKNVQECRCGSKRCRGILGPKTKEEKKQKEEVVVTKKAEGKLAGAKRKIVEVLEESTSRMNKRVRLEEKTTLIKSPPSKVRVLKKKVVVRKVSMPNASGLNRRPSKLQRLKDRTTGRRVVSSASEKQALIEKDDATGLKRSTSLREKVGSLKRNVVRSMRGR